MCFPDELFEIMNEQSEIDPSHPLFPLWLELQGKNIYGEYEEEDN